MSAVPHTGQGSLTCEGRMTRLPCFQGDPDHTLAYVCRQPQVLFTLSTVEVNRAWAQVADEFLKGVLTEAAATVHEEPLPDVMAMLCTGALPVPVDALPNCDTLPLKAQSSNCSGTRLPVLAPPLSAAVGVSWLVCLHSGRRTMVPWSVLCSSEFVMVSITPRYQGS